MSQSMNVDACLYYPWVRLVRRSLAIPHFSVPNINSISPDRLAACGFKGVVFDKDNTLTAPYAAIVHPEVAGALDRFKAVFGTRMAILSNHAGTADDAGYQQADDLENTLGIHVLRHRRKKPAGIAAVVDYFGCTPEDIAMVGDRVFTDIVFGNRYGMLTVLTAVLTRSGDNPAAVHARSHELRLLNSWQAKGLQPPVHTGYQPDICVAS